MLEVKKEKEKIVITALPDYDGEGAVDGVYVGLSNYSIRIVLEKKAVDYLKEVINSEEVEDD